MALNPDGMGDAPPDNEVKFLIKEYGKQYAKLRLLLSELNSIINRPNAELASNRVQQKFSRKFQKFDIAMRKYYYLYENNRRLFALPTNSPQTTALLNGLKNNQDSLILQSFLIIKEYDAKLADTLQIYLRVERPRILALYEPHCPHFAIPPHVVENIRDLRDYYKELCVYYSLRAREHNRLSGINDIYRFLNRNTINPDLNQQLRETAEHHQSVEQQCREWLIDACKRRSYLNKLYEAAIAPFDLCHP